MVRIISLLFVLILSIEMQTPQSVSRNSEGSWLWHGFFRASDKWPHPVACRIQDGRNRDLFIMTLGDVQTTIADGIYDPRNDEVALRAGTIISNYYRDSQGIKFYKPIDKSVFPLPPSGWCSWYYYYQEIDEKEIERNARWIAEHLKDYGAQYIQIDDGWQGTGRGMGENRDWTTVDKRFAGGMDRLASGIRKLGLRPGIWLAPHGQSNEAVVKNHAATFLFKPDGSSASDTWEGKFLVDPSTAEAHAYLKNLFTTLASWGYDYFKIDGQPIVINEYTKNRSLMRNPPDDVLASYRGTLESIRHSLGPGRYLLGCWGIPLPGVGLMNGSRTGGDVVLGWDGFKVAWQATMRYYFLHNVAWYCDPDVMLLRSPLTLDQARAWATLQGLTGQALMASDRMMDLPGERVEILRRVYPAADIRPMDLFPSKRSKPIWDLKVHHLGRNYDVVGVFNLDENKVENRFLEWTELGYADTALLHVFDFWNREYLGAWEKGIAVDVPPTSCRVLTLMSSEDRAQLLSTNRHITQGWIDLVKLEYDARTNAYSGRSMVVKNDLYELCFAFPRGKNLIIKDASAGNLPVTINNYQGWAVLRFASPRTTEIDWHVSFVPANFYSYPVNEASELAVSLLGLDGVNVEWADQYYLNSGYQVYLDGRLIGYTPMSHFPLRRLRVDSTYTVSMRPVWLDGRVGDKESTQRFALRSLLPDEVWLSDFEPDQATAGWRTVGTNRSVSGKRISIGGRPFQYGIGTHADSEIEFDVKGLYETFSVTVGIDDGSQSDKGSVEFIVAGDGKELWRSGILRKADGAKPVAIRIAGIQKLLLKVTDGGDGIDYDHADWAEAKISGLRQSRE